MTNKTKDDEWLGLLKNNFRSIRQATKDASEEPITLNSEESGMRSTATIMLMLQDFPLEVREAFDAEVGRAFMTQMPVIREIAEKGLQADRADFRPLATVFTDAMVLVEKNDGMKLTATLKDVGSRIAEEIDNSVSRVLLQAKKVDRHAMREVTYCHDRLLAALQQLAICAEEQSGL